MEFECYYLELELERDFRKMEWSCVGLELPISGLNSSQTKYMVRGGRKEGRDREVIYIGARAKCIICTYR